MKNKSTYSLLINSNREEKGRSIFEVSVYALVLLCLAFAGWQFAATTVTVPGGSPKPAAAQSMLAEVPINQTSPAIVSRG